MPRYRRDALVSSERQLVIQKDALGDLNPTQREVLCSELETLLAALRGCSGGLTARGGGLGGHARGGAHGWLRQ
ncbi:hypothetical protein ACN28S_67505 [Cystobacter fuscus]